MKTTAIVTALASILAASAWADSIPFEYDIFDQLTRDDDCERYIGPDGAPYRTPAVSGQMRMRVLRHMDGIPLRNIVLAHVHALRPSEIRIVDPVEWKELSESHLVRPELHPWRVSIVVKDGKVQAVYQDVNVGYASGMDVEVVTREIRDGKL